MLIIILCFNCLGNINSSILLSSINLLTRYIMSLNMISSLHSYSFWMTGVEDEIIKLIVIVLLCSITSHFSKIEMIGNTIDMPRIDKGDFILANIPLDLPEDIPFL